MANRIQIAYKLDNDPDEGLLIRMTGLDYYRHTKGFACASNRRQTGEPYNYFSEIEDAMHANGRYELMEGIWEVPEDGIDVLSRELAAAGLILVLVNE